MLCFSSDNRLLQTKGLECLRPEEGGVCRDIVVVYQDKDTAEPYLKALPRLRDDVITSALKVCPGQLCFLAPSSGLSLAFPLGFRWGGDCSTGCAASWLLNHIFTLWLVVVHLFCVRPSSAIHSIPQLALTNEA